MADSKTTQTRRRPRRTRALRGATALLLTVMAAATVAAAAGISRRIVLSGFEEVERQSVALEVMHAQKLVHDNAADLAIRFEDWSAWDDPYEFVQDGNQRFVDSNLRKESLATARIDAIIFVNTAGHVVYSVAHDRESGENKPVPAELLAHLPAIVGNPADERDVSRGLLGLPDGLMSVISNPLLTSARTGPCHGKLIIGRYLRAREIARLSHVSRVGLFTRGLNEDLPPDFKEATEHLANGVQAVVRERDGSTISGYAHLLDLDGKPIAVLRVDVPRTILQQGRRSTFSSTMAIALTAVPFLVLALVLMSRLERARAAIGQRERYYRALIEGGSDLILLLDDEQLVRYHSPSVPLALKKPSADLIGKPWVDLVDPQDQQTVSELIAQARSGGVADVRGTFRCVRGDHSTAVVEAIFKDLSSDPAVDGVLINGRDVTEREQIAKERARLEAELRQSQKLEAVGRLAGGIAHDFNNLLTVILGHADLLARGNLVGVAAEGVVALRAAAKRAAALTQQLLSFSRKQVIAPQVVDLNVAVERARDMLSRLIGEDVRLTFQPGEDIWPVRVDPNQLDQILLNLAVNARDAMPDGGTLSIQTSCQTVDDEFASRHPGLAAGDYAIVSVADTGTGIPAEVLPYIFEPFYTTKPTGKGTGLGLATVYGLVRQHGGYAMVDTVDGHGTTFRVLLPRSERASEPEAVRLPPLVGGKGHANILLVEDDDAVRELACTFLDKAGFHVTMASGPLEAIELAKVNRVAMLVTDVIMPEMNGRELATALRGAIPGLRVLYVSGYTDTILQKLPELDSSEDFLQKPFQGDTLIEKVIALLAR